MTKLRQALRARVAATIAMALVLAAVVAGCGTSASTSTSTGTTENKTIMMAVVPGWTAEIGVMHLYKNILESKGYTVSFKEFSEIAPIFLGAANGDIDAFPGDPERTHKAYWDQYKDKLEDAGTYFDNSSLYLAVADYMTDIQSISDLPAHAAEFGGKVVGIEPGAGLTKVTQEKAFPDYGLGDSFKLQLSSTAAMLTEVKRATDAKEPIVVTLWQPFWANSAFPLRALKDPKGSFGGPEGNHALTRKGFSQDHPEAAALMSKLKLSDEQLASLDDFVSNKFPTGQEDQAIKAWLDQNPDFIKGL